MPDTPATGLLSWIKELVSKEGVLAALVVFLVLVMTGVVATPLMEGLRIIPMLYADTTDSKTVLEGIFRTVKAQCLNSATTEEQISRCNWN